MSFVVLCVTIEAGVKRKRETERRMAMATAVASTSFTALRSSTFGAGVQGLRVANQKVSAVRLGSTPFVSAKLATSSDGLAQQVAVGGNTLAGTNSIPISCIEVETVVGQ